MAGAVRVGSLLALLALYLRARLVESEAFTEQRIRPERPTLRAFREHPRAVARVVGFTVGGTVAYYTFAVYLPSYAQQAKGTSTEAALWASVAAQVALMVVLPLFGALSDRVGRRPLLIYIGVVFVLLSVPLFAWLSSSGWSLFAVMTVGLVLFAGYGAMAPVAMAEPTAVRTAGIALRTDRGCVRRHRAVPGDRADPERPRPGLSVVPGVDLPGQPDRLPGEPGDPHGGPAPPGLITGVINSLVRGGAGGPRRGRRTRLARSSRCAWVGGGGRWGSRG
jgi:hypothetical protein